MTHTRQHFGSVRIESVRIGFPGQRSRPKRCLDGGNEFVWVAGDDVIERIVPEIEDLEWQRPPSRLGIDQFVGEFQDSIDVVIIDMAHHEQIYSERFALGQSSRLANFLQSRL